MSVLGCYFRVKLRLVQTWVTVLNIVVIPIRLLSSGTRMRKSKRTEKEEE